MSDLFSLAATMAADNADAPLPVHAWHPAHCGAIDIEIRADGSWWHLGTPILRPALVRLLARVLRRDPEGYVLVTPAEKLSIRVIDVPFVIVAVEAAGEDIRLRTNLGELVTVGPDHPLRMRKAPDGTELAYVEIRAGLEARMGRAAWFDLVAAAVERPDGTLAVRSGGIWYPLGAHG